MNEVFLLGNAGSDIAIKYTPSGMGVGEFGLATSSGRKDNEGNWINQTEWHNIVMLGKTAERAAGQIIKGSKVFIKGKIETKKWDGKDGLTHYKTQITAFEFSVSQKSPNASYETEEDIPL